jgi:uncharacterized protein (DUF2147 family)
MRKLTVLASLLAVLAAPALADPVHGTWKTLPDDNGNFGHVRMETCENGKICGALIASFNGAGERIQSPNLGRQIVWDMEPQGNGAYGKGKVYAPDRDKTYNSKMELRGNTLGVSGGVFGIWRESQWTRIN